jgi:hypothetical protein
MAALFWVVLSFLLSFPLALFPPVENQSVHVLYL